MDNQQTDEELGYPKPPITEAVIERRFATPLDPQELEKLRAEFEQTYPAVSQLAELSIAVPGDGSTPIMSQTPTGYRLVHRNGAAIIVLTNIAIAYAQLAPYIGWRGFKNNAFSVFQSVRDTIGYRALARIGVRYINRLDIPLSSTDFGPGIPELDDYLLIGVKHPDNIVRNFRSLTVQCAFPIDDIECEATINAASIVSPVPNHASFLLDIDIGKMVNVPQKEEDISNLLDIIRHKKNWLFEACITDKTRSLFR
jgi:uncharacterized protein (TIGR04255 family)